MPAGRPHGRNDPSLMSSLESALTGARRPGAVELGWRWRWELTILVGLASLAAFIAINVGLIGLAVAASPAVADRGGMVCDHPAQSPSRMRECLGADQERQASDRPGRHACRLRRTGPDLAAGRHHGRRPGRRQRRPCGRLLGGRGPGRPQSEARSPSHPAGN